MKIWTKPVMVLLAVMGLSACYPESRHPLSSPEETVADLALIGLWYGGEADDPESHAYYAILKTGEQDMDIIGFNFEGDKDEWLLLGAKTTTIGDAHFMSLQIRGESGDNEVGKRAASGEEIPYLLSRYEITDDGKLHVYLMDASAMKAALAAETGEVSDDEVLKAPTEVMRKVIEQGGAEEIFSDEIGIYERRS